MFTSDNAFACIVDSHRAMWNGTICIFRVLKNNDKRMYGEDRMRRLVLEA